MNFYRLVKPKWAQPVLANGESNNDFTSPIEGPNTYEGCFDTAFLTEKNNLGYNIYFFPNHPSSNVYETGVKHLSGKHIEVFNFAFIDMDLKDGIYASKSDFLDKLNSFPLKPTLVVDSGNGIHAYWRINDLDRKKYVLLQMSLLSFFKTDQSVWTVLQLMRVPAYFNTKKHGQFVQALVLEEHSSSNSYSVKDFPKEIFLLTDDQYRKIDNHIARLEGRVDINLGESINIDELPDEFIDLLKKDSTIFQLFHDPKSVGDRSSADMKLANILFNHKFNSQQAIAVIANSQKALEKGAHRLDYATLTVSKVYSDRPSNKISTVSEFLRTQGTEIQESQVLGPYYLDYGVLGNPWRRKQLLGLIAGAGIGKTAMALNIIRDTIQNNPHNSDVYIFFSLEMPKSEIIEKWVGLVGANSPLADRLYVEDTQDAQGMPRTIGLQEMYDFCSEVKQVTAKQIGMIVVDHFHIVSTHINVNKKPNFGIQSEQGAGWGEIRNLSLNALATQFKSLIKAVDTFGIILSQTTKEKGVGDLPIAKDGSYGASQFEWIMDRIITIWQPLMRVQHLTDTRFLAFQYAKIRHKHKNDKVKELNPHLLTYDMDMGSLAITSQKEYETFLELKPKADELRDAALKKKSNQYSIQVNLNGVDDIMKHLGIKS